MHNSPNKPIFFYYRYKLWQSAYRALHYDGIRMTELVFCGIPLCMFIIIALTAPKTSRII